MSKVVKEILKISNISLDKIISRDDIIKFINNVRDVLFIGYTETISSEIEVYLEEKIELVSSGLSELLVKISCNKDEISKITNDFINYLPNIKKQLNGDLKAFLLSDPAVEDEQEVIHCYPGYYAISLYRIAHCLSNLNVSILPRVICEHAHSKTGIDIHPRAEIKNNFFIDHGTGVVIGETSTIGNNVRIHHGVTLGALSLENIDTLKNVKRHPTIEDNVIIYSNTSILGGKTIIGENSIIGCNVIISKSVKKNTKIIFNNLEELQKVKEI